MSIDNTGERVPHKPSHRIRVEKFDPDWQSRSLEEREQRKEWIEAEVLEFHPDWDNRMKFRSRAYVKPTEELRKHPGFDLCGEGFLDEPYLDIREFYIHPSDLRELKAYCRLVCNYDPLIFQKCPLPYPMFKAGERVKVVVQGEKEHAEGVVGQIATVLEDSSMGGRTSILFDDPRYMAWNGKPCTTLSFSSIYLRKAEEVQL